ncbi:MobF family relaxase [Klenkia sp. PcliD-1-E]|uniref:MobF family relaxase n=1 Tax=Klenkia sp. PcliD-1-E TaxID=2954492 RepID=UPI002097C064|nr:MobF family relaxase [Klenkia sp. PcliD-1-E]MCO7218290.1 relaxase domain-containing protein [Klenkia sp. PcliD-1-E]
MTVHKLTAGDGYTYLSRQVAAQDTTAPAPGGLSAYYMARGESPGRWMGRGLDGLTGDVIGPDVAEAQMLALFGEGRHPNRVQVEQDAAAAGAVAAAVDRASRLGAPYPVFAAVGEFRRRSAIAYREFNAAHGEAGTTGVPAEDRARIRTEIAVGMFREQFGRDPLNPRELSGHLARISRQQTTAVAGYDLTFSPVKSVSTLWAIAPREVAEVIERAHADAVADVLGWLEDHATFSRTGRHGVAQIDVHGLLAAAFTHRDSRAGDPDLHTHVAISNKVQTVDGRWLALDGRPLYANVVAASERYNTRIEVFLVERLGVRFAERPGSETGKRAVREIVGIDGPLPRLWSSRRAAIDTRRAALATTFQADHGRPPTTREAIQLAQQANLETRQAKHEPRTHAEQRAAWRAEALAALGGEQQLDRFINRALHPGRRPPGPDVTPAWLDTMAAAAVARVGTTRATWQETHLRAEAERRARHAGVRTCDLDRVVEDIVTRALSPPTSRRLTPLAEDGEPAVLRRVDGASMYEVVGSAHYTSDEVLDAERAVLDAAARFDGHVTPSEAVDDALRSAEESGRPLNSGQATFVRALACSGARLQVAVAPAGTGKTFALRTLAAAWRAGSGTVIGLAPSAAASSVLREQLGDSTDTVAKFVHATQTGVDVPDWLTTVGPTSLVVIDEAGAATTQDLACVVTTVLAAGGSVRLIGDDQQLGPVGAGGLLADLARSHGAARLDEVVRFTHPDTGVPNTVEGATSLALRDGDPAALAYYADRGRLQVGDLSSCLDQTYTAWSADRAAGRDPLMLAPTRDLVTQLNLRARTDRLAREGPARREVALADGTAASAGDVVISRRNDRTLPNGTTGWVTNGDRWTITAVRPSGAVDVVHTATAALVTLPADYIRDHVTLGYATTVHSAQGVTADTSYTVVTGTESRQQLYVALTRGRHSNHAYVTVTGDGDPHTAITRDGVLPPTAIEVLQRILTRDDTPRSATSIAADQDDPARQLAAEVGRYLHALATAAEEQVGSDGMAAIDRAAETTVAGLTDAPAYPALRADLALHAAAGYDPAQILQEATDDPRGLDTARDAAAVLDWRIGPPGPDGPPPPLPWLPATPQVLGEDPVWGSYLTRRANRVRDHAQAVADRATSWTPTSAPMWARPLSGDPALLRDLAVWRAATSTEPSDPRPTGGPSTTAADAAHQQHLDDRVRRCVGASTTDAVRWAAALRGAAPDVIDDPYWPVLLDKLTTARISDPNGRSLLAALTVRPLPDEQPAAALWWRLVDHLPVHATEPTGQPLDAIETPINNPTPPPARNRTVERTLRGRVLELNDFAADFYDSAYADSWAQNYLVTRLGTDPLGTTEHAVGYAPNGWTTLVEHLRDTGATDEELVAAGLATRSTSGRLIDRFRDRVMFAIQDDDGIVGWIGRRNPDRDRHPHPAAPKYLNTPATVAFTKGHHLFGLHEARAHLTTGTTPVLVEGPIDALAVTLAGAHQYVGIAPLGTAFTDVQADLLQAATGSKQAGLIVAMDSDAAGRLSAERIYWTIGAKDAGSLALPDGDDPASFLQVAGADALLRALRSPTPLADVVVDRRIDELQDRLATVEGQVAAVRRSAEVIAALPVHRWPALLTHVVARTGVAPDIALAETFTASDRHHPAGIACSVDPTVRTGAGVVESSTHPPAQERRPAMATRSALLW